MLFVSMLLYFVSHLDSKKVTDETKPILSIQIEIVILNFMILHSNDLAKNFRKIYLEVFHKK